MDCRLGGWRQEVLWLLAVTGLISNCRFYPSALGGGRGPVGSPTLSESSPTYSLSILISLGKLQMDRYEIHWNLTGLAP